MAFQACPVSSLPRFNSSLQIGKAGGVSSEALAAPAFVFVACGEGDSFDEEHNMRMEHHKQQKAEH
eukprot:scaffold3651_cov157-Pinguiococcus_pyrenoidosus.AAC.2